MKIRREFKIGDNVPIGWGLAYREWDRCVGVFYPIPFNFLIGWTVDLYLRLMAGPRSMWIDKHLKEMVSRETASLQTTVNFMKDKVEVLETHKAILLQDAVEREGQLLQIRLEVGKIKEALTGRV